MASKLLVATRKGLFSVERGKAWRITAVDFLGDNCSAVLENPVNGTMLAALDHGHFGAKLHRSTDGGKSWHEIEAPKYPPRSEDEEDWVDMHGRTIPDSLVLVWCLEADHPDRADGVWCGTVPGGLFYSDDRGDTWRLVESLWDHPLRRRWFGGGMDYPGIHSVCIDPGDPGRISIGVSCGGVWVSRDAGEKWECVGEGWRSDYLPPELLGDPAIQDVHRLGQCGARPDALWVQHHNGIFRSVDGGQHWTELENVSPSAFGFALAAHPSDPDTAWFVPEIKDERRIPVDGRLVVNRTRDGGRNFETLSRGLPQEHAYDLVYRHGLAVDAEGKVLAMGSTTGSLFLSDDGGESWQCVSTHLPPVYALRFVESSG